LIGRNEEKIEIPWMNDGMCFEKMKKKKEITNPKQSIFISRNNFQQNQQKIMKNEIVKISRLTDDYKYNYFSTNSFHCSPHRLFFPSPTSPRQFSFALLNGVIFSITLSTRVL
jgi:hypothetical protein